jgi:hypothetical protein
VTRPLITALTHPIALPADSSAISKLARPTGVSPRSNIPPPSSQMWRMRSM